MTKKTREVLELAKNLLAHHANGGDWEAQQSQRVIEAINECLTEPIRNCDVWTSDLHARCEWEQVRRRYYNTYTRMAEWLLAPVEGGVE